MNVLNINNLIYKNAIFNKYVRFVRLYDVLIKTIVLKII